MNLPEITHLQFAVLDCLASAEQRGQHIRGKLAEAGVRQSGPAFYRMMSRLEDAGFVTGSYVQEIINSQIIKERRYEITPQGHSAWEDTRRFYLQSRGAKALEGNLADV